jgi:AFG3 family protein
MSPTLGPVSYAVEEGYQKPYSDKTNRLIDSEVKQIIDNAYKRCKALLSEKKDLI